MEINQRLRHAVRVTMYVMLFMSAGAAFLLGDRLWAAARGGTLPVWTALVAPVAFTAFVAAYALDRWFLVRRRNYPLGRATFQVAFAIVFLSLLWPQQGSELRRLRQERDHLGPALRLLRHGDAGVRAATCELLRAPLEGDVYDLVKTLSQSDKSASVRAACADALQRLHALGVGL